MGNAVSRKKDGSSRSPPVFFRSDKIHSRDAIKTFSQSYRRTLDNIKWNPKRASSASAGEQEKAAARERKWKGPNAQIRKSMIGKPTNFQHITHLSGGYPSTTLDSTLINHQITSLIPTDQPEFTMPVPKPLDEAQPRPPSPAPAPTPPPMNDALSPPPRSSRDRELTAEEREFQKQFTKHSTRRRSKRPFSYDSTMGRLPSSQLPSPPLMDRELNISATGRSSPTTLGKPKQVPLKDAPSDSNSRPRRHSGSSFAPSSPSHAAFDQDVIAIGQPIWDPKQINSVWNESSVPAPSSTSAPSTMRRSTQEDFMRRSLHEDCALSDDTMGLGPKHSTKSRDAARRYTSRSEGSLGLDFETSALFGLHEPASKSARSLEMSFSDL